MVFGFFEKSSNVAKDGAKKIGGKKKDGKLFGENMSVVDRLTVAQLEEFREAFSTFDKDSSGAINAKELRALMASVGQNLSDEELAEMIRIADADGSGEIDFAEFVTLMAHKMHDEKSDETLRAAFNVFDTSGDGIVNTEELQRIMLNVGETASLEDVEFAVAKLTRERNIPKGVIDFDVFRSVIHEEKNAF